MKRVSVNECKKLPLKDQKTFFLHHRSELNGTCFLRELFTLSNMDLIVEKQLDVLPVSIT